MFEYLTGVLVLKKPTVAVIEVGGIGYRLMIPASSFDALPEAGSEARLLVHHYVREDVIALYGFATEAERVIFEMMLSVSGVGPKLALAALSAIEAEELRGCVVQGDIHRLTGIPGVGRKTAERLTVELRDRFGRIGFEGDGSVPGGSVPKADEREDALRALESLGVSRAVAERSLKKIERTQPGPHSAEELVRLALRDV